MATSAAKLFKAIGLRSTKTSMLMLLVAWTFSLAWLGLNYFWRFASVEVLVTIPLLSLIYAIVALIAYVYWGVRNVREKDAPFANLLVGIIIATTLLYFNFELLQIVLKALKG